MRILVIEDDPKLAGFVTGGLKQAGFAVDHAADGRDGLALARQGHYAAAVVDLMLPKLDGLALIETLRAEKSPLPAQSQTKAAMKSAGRTCLRPRTRSKKSGTPT